jgi:hypothetical protein
MQPVGLCRDFLRQLYDLGSSCGLGLELALEFAGIFFPGRYVLNDTLTRCEKQMFSFPAKMPNFTKTSL